MTSKPIMIADWNESSGSDWVVAVGGALFPR
jgi:hypothetical protein